MDYYSFNPNAADSLEFVSPSLQRNFANVNNRVYHPEYSKEHAELVKSAPSRNRPFRADRPSSTSLILQKTTERELKVHEYSEYNNNNLQYKSFINPRPKPRPVIKVTVIPNNASIQKLRKRRSCTKKVQTTVSNQENSIKAKNVYLVVAGKKREKVYEIKTTGSAEFSNNHLHYTKNEELAVEENIKKFLNSLNMDKRKKSRKKSEESDNDDECGTINVNVFDNSEGVRESRNYCQEEVRQNRSRVRISGKIGRTEDDRLVLKCAAMVDGKPVETNFMQGSEFIQIQAPRCYNQTQSVPWTEEESREFIKRRLTCQKGACQKGACLKEANVQADLHQAVQEDSYIISPTTYPVFLSTRSTYRSVETQCNPGNFNTVCFSNIEKLRIVSNRDQIVQCNCPTHCPSPMCADPGTDLDTYSRTPNTCSNPLVIISVYPNQEKVDKATGEEPGPRDRREPKERDSLEFEEPKEPKEEKNKKGNNKKRGGKAKAITPVSSEEKPRARSPGRSKSPTNKKTKVKIEEKNTKPSKKSTNEVKSKNIKVGVLPLIPASGKYKKGKTERSNPIVEKSTNTERDRRCPCPDAADQKKPMHLKTNAVMNWVSAKNKVSAVSISIDGKKDTYDVLYRQGDNMADLRVRKSFKEQGSQKHIVDGDSLENFLLRRDGQDARKTSFSQTFLLDDPPKISIDLERNKEHPGLQPRDSIDLLHRKEGGRSSHDVSTTLPSSNTSVTSDKPFFVPIKHFQGDSCNVTNPMERDKQIQELLGVDTRLAPSRFIEKTTQKTEVDLSPNIFVQAKWSTDVQSEIESTVCSIYKMDKIECACYHDNKIKAIKEESSSSESKAHKCTSALKVVEDPPKTEAKENKEHVREPGEIKNYVRESRHHLTETRDRDHLKEAREDRDHLKEPRKYRDHLKELREYRDHVKEPREYRDHVREPREYRDHVRESRISLHEPTEYRDHVNEPREYREHLNEPREYRDIVNECRAHSREPREYRDNLRNTRAHLREPMDYRDHLREPRGYRDRFREPQHHLRAPIAQTAKCKRIQCSNKPLATYSPPEPCPPSCGPPCCGPAPYEDPPVSPEPTDCCCEEPAPQAVPPLYQQLILNRNINIYLQIDQFTKQKPIILSRKQYDKVKRTIESATNKKPNCICKNSCLSIGETRKRCTETCGFATELNHKTNQAPFPNSCCVGVQSSAVGPKLLGGIRKSVQFEYVNDCDGDPLFLRESSCVQNNVIDRNACVSIAQEKHGVKIEEENENYHDEPLPFRVNATHKIRSAADVSMGQGDTQCGCDPNKVNKQSYVREKHRPKPGKTRLGALLGKFKHLENETCNQADFTQQDDEDCGKCGTMIRLHTCKVCGRKTQECFKNECYFCELNKKRELSVHNLFERGAARFASSTEVRYTSVTYLKHVTFSSTNVNPNNERKPSVVNLLEKNYGSDSLHTLFKGRKRTPTPNLGTSVYSIYSEYSDRTSKSKLNIQEPPPRKPFLRRLMSCLVMRSKTSQVKVGKRPQKVPSVNSSIDSYHISTSLGAIELSSSIYDTSASFYSSHSIQPLSSKLKRSFLSSVRGFLNYRRN